MGPEIRRQAAVAQSVGIVRLRTQAMEFSLVFFMDPKIFRTLQKRFSTFCI
jgi:hypothetical protein